MFDVTARQAKLIEMMSNESRYLPARYYAEHLNVSERTIFNDIAKLDSVLKEMDVTVEKKPNKGIKLTGEMSTSGIFNQLTKKSLKSMKNELYTGLDRQILMVKWLLLENKTMTYQSLSYELYCSSSSISKDLNHIQYFMDEDVHLVSDIKGTRVIGDEIAIQRTLKRFAYYVLNQQMHTYSIASYAKSLEILFDKRIIQSVESATNELMSNLTNETSEQYLKSLFIFLIILTERAYKGNHIRSLPKVGWKPEESLSNLPIAAQIGDSIHSYLDFIFTETELQYISNQLFAHRIEVKLNNKYIENLFTEDIQNLIERVSTSMDMDLTMDKRLFDSLTYHMVPLIYRLKTNTVIYNPLMSEIKESYKLLFQMVWYAMEEIENKYDIKVSDNEIAFISIYFQAAIERKVQMRRVLVVCQTGIVTSDLIMNRIKNLLPKNIDFKLIAKHKLPNEDISNVDFIISSVNLEHENCPIIHVSPIINEKDLKNIYAHYLKYSSSKEDDITENVQINSNTSFLDHKYLFCNEKMTDKSESLNMMINTFEKDQIVSKEFKKSVYEREELGNTIIEKQIAVPHGNQSAVKQTKIAMMYSKQPIKWSYEVDVHLIILLAVTEEDMERIRKLLSQLYRNILNLNSIENYLKNITDRNQLIQLFTANK